MGVRLVLIDHHIGVGKLERYDNVTIIKTDSLDFFYDITGKYLDDDYDMIISDEDPDGVTSAILYLLGKNKNIKFVGNRSGLSSTSLADLEKQGVTNILALDWFPINFSEIQAFSEVIILNPVMSGLVNVNTSEIVYRSLFTDNEFLRDISVVGTLCDYLVDTSKEKFNDFMNSYKDVFPELYEVSFRHELDRYNAYRLNGSYTKLFDISLMFWAPFIIDGQEGNNKIIDLIIKNPNFTMADLIYGSDNLAVVYLRELFIKLLTLINFERENFYKEVKIIGNVYLYSPKNYAQGLMSKFSSIISDEVSEKNPMAVVIMKGLSNNNAKYSLRTSHADYNLGKVLNTITENGGGHPTAAGVNLSLDKVEDFENKLFGIINNNLDK